MHEKRLTNNSKKFSQGCRLINEQKLANDIVENSGDAIIAINLKGNVLFWNKGAEDLFGYNKKEVIGKFAPFITSHSLHEFEHLIEKAKSNNKSCFRTSKKNKNGSILDLILIASPLLYKNSVIGASIIAREAKMIRNACYLPLNMDITQREQKRTFIDIRKLILNAMFEKKKTINQIANDSGVNWRTVEKHLTYFLGKKFVEEVSNSKYLRVFELTLEGESLVKKFRKEEMEKYLKS